MTPQAGRNKEFKLSKERLQAAFKRTVNFHKAFYSVIN